MTVLELGLEGTPSKGCGRIWTNSWKLRGTADVHTCSCGSGHPQAALVDWRRLGHQGGRSLGNSVERLLATNSGIDLPMCGLVCTGTCQPQFQIAQKTVHCTCTWMNIHWLAVGRVDLDRDMCHLSVKQFVFLVNLFVFVFIYHQPKEVFLPQVLLTSTYTCSQ